ncbi:hypothetical protein DASC09_049540 [Saccharomycopsis crataegensis]|uniref:Vacuolar ATPase assembly protein VMA22 n=1 Tax=Saccharomycopsis crataegensis TaxID=43959 RepID=A0AAV5QSC0_9ASCO|nr:hypothetical protein DASC09_049540 [Saccharomycopsis crataegensis]
MDDLIKIPTDGSSRKATSHIEEYFSVLDETYQLTNEINKKASDAFFSLTRANISSHGVRTKKFGRDFYDYRDRKATLTVSCEKDGWKLVDGLEFDEAAVTEELKKNVSSIKKSVLADDNKSRLKNRSKEEKEKGKKDLKDEISRQVDAMKLELKKQNPIRMFNGGLVPKDLNTTQESFAQLIHLLLKLSAAKTRLKEIQLSMKY